MISRKFFILSIITFSFAVNLFSVDFDNGNIRLRINNKTGRYSLFYLTDPVSMRYEPLFYSREASSYLSVNVDGTVYKLGKSKNFTTTVEMDTMKPAVVVYQSPFLTVTKTFTPVQTFSSSGINGIKIDITLQNTGDASVSAGLRALIDTSLGEGFGKHPSIITQNQEIARERIIQNTSDELYWISRNQNLSLMGTIVNPLDKNTITPDYIHIANWKRLNKAPWGLDYVHDRRFDYRPYFIDDSAICYYYEPITLETGDSITYTIFLTTEDITWYNIGSDFDFSSYQALSLTDADRSIDPDYLLLLRMKEVLNKFLSGEIVLNERDLDEIEGNINRLNAKFNLY